MSDTQFTPGKFCWWDLGTTDAAGAKAFYSGLFGWTPRDVPMGEGGAMYTMFEVDGKQAAAAFPMDPSLGEMPPHWQSYIGVESADAAAAKAKSLNGTILMEPFDVMTEGRMAVIQDPTGAVVSVWEPKNHKGAQHVDALGGVCWNELGTRDSAAAGEFYSKMFGYDVDVMPFDGSTYTILKQGDAQRAGVMQMNGEQFAGIPPHWMPYFWVENAAASVETAKKLGASIKVPSTPIPGIGNFAVIQDPQGAVFSILEPAEMN
jgi:predicted enzyme related to lactoylglutathione lyase